MSNFSPGFTRLLNQHVLDATIRQLRFSAFIGDRPHHPTDDPLTLEFADIALPAQVLGTASPIESSWIWAWSMPTSRIPRAAQSASVRLKELGELRDVPELIEARRRLAAADIFTHILGTVAVGALNAAGYYVAQHDAGDVLHLVESYPEQDTSMPSIRETASVFTELTQSVALDHKDSLLRFLDRHAIAHTEDEGRRIQAVWPEGGPEPGDEEARTMIAVYDRAGRFSRMIVPRFPATT